MDAPTLLHAPWHSHFPLTADAAARIVGADVPELEGSNATYLGEGWDFTVFLVGGAWVFRFPKRRQAARQLARELRLLETVRPSLAGTMAVPEYRFVVERSTAFPTAYAGYRYLAGDCLLERNRGATDPRSVGATVGAFLGRLHALAPWPAPRRVGDDLSASRGDFRRELEEAEAAMPQAVAAACRRLLADEPEPWCGTPAFVHGDLGAEHILCDATGRVFAVIDWGDAGWGDPLADFVGLWAWGGDAAARAALDAAGRRPTDAGWRRLRRWGACYAIGTVYYGYKARQDALRDVGLEWLARMNANGQLDDPGRADG